MKQPSLRTSSFDSDAMPIPHKNITQKKKNIFEMKKKMFLILKTLQLSVQMHNTWLIK
jgi:hypothetical protein